MAKQSIILIGGGGHCRSCIDVIEQTDVFEIAGIVDRLDSLSGNVFDYPVLGNDDALEMLRKTIDHCLVTVGHIKSSTTRENLYRKLKSLGFSLPVIISPTSYVSKRASLGEGSIVMHGATVNAGVRIGNNCILNSHSLIEHDAKIGSHTHISTSAVINGGASVGARCFIGSNATMVQGVKVPDDYFFRATQLITSKRDGFPVVEE